VSPVPKVDSEFLDNILIDDLAAVFRQTGLIEGLHLPAEVMVLGGYTVGYG
jgi:hypothetical protein